MTAWEGELVDDSMEVIGRWMAVYVGPGGLVDVMVCELDVGMVGRVGRIMMMIFYLN